MWFIITLYWYFVLTPLWRVVLNRKWAMWLTLLIVIVLHFYHPTTDFLCIGWAFRYVIWFYLGLVISKEKIVKRVLDRKPILTLIAGIVIYCVGFRGQGAYFSFVSTLGGIILSFAIALSADKYIPKLFFTFRNYTYQIFLLGIFAQMLLKIIYPHISIPYFLGYIICILLGLYVPVLVAKIVEKVNWKPLSLCYGLK